MSAVAASLTSDLVTQWAFGAKPIFDFSTLPIFPFSYYGYLPLLVMGTLTGDIYGHLIVNYLHANPLYVTNFIVFAMAAYFAAIVKAPITGSILITEMTGSFHHLLALITISMTAYIITDILNSKPIYEELLHRVLAKNRKQDLCGKDHGKKVVIEADVCLGSQLNGKKIKEVKWPSHCLIVSIRRGDTEIIPNGDTKIMALCIYR